MVIMAVRQDSTRRAPGPPHSVPQWSSKIGVEHLHTGTSQDHLLALLFLPPSRCARLARFMASLPHSQRRRNSIHTALICPSTLKTTVRMTCLICIAMQIFTAGGGEVHHQHYIQMCPFCLSKHALVPLPAEQQCNQDRGKGGWG